MVRLVLVLTAALLLGICGESAGQPATYLARQMRQALEERDAFLRDATGSQDPATFTAVVTTQEQLSALEQYYRKSRAGVRTTWHCFYQAVLLRQKASAARPYLLCALQGAVDDPGSLWVLKGEVERYGFGPIADTVQTMLERALMVQGAQTAPAIAQQAMHEAIRSMQAGETEQAERQWAAVRTYDPSTPWPALWSIRTDFPRRTDRITASITNIVYVLTHSWQVQLAAVHHGLKWLLHILRMLVVGVFVALFLKHFTKAVHPYAERFPKAVPALVRTLLMGSFALSLLAFGSIPFFWVLAFILWPSMHGRERVVAGACLVAIALTPIGAVAESALRTCRSPTNSPVLFARAIQEGYTPELYQYLSERAQKRPGDGLALAACAVSALKGDSVRTARRWAEAAAKARPDDPVVLTLLGATSQLAGNHKDARTHFERCLQNYPYYAPAYFNLGKSLLNQMETLKGADLITQAAELDKTHIETFVKRNDSFFGQNWPRNRQIVVADYPPDYFWEHLLKQYVSSERGVWEDTTALWGVSFLGLTPLHSLIVFALLLVVLLIRENVVKAARKSRVKKVLVCELCGAAMCKLCAKGPYCGTCFGALSSIQSEQRRTAAKVKLFEGARRREAWLASLLDVLFPGAGMLFETRVQHRTALLVIPLTALLFGSTMTLLTLRYTYPQWITERLFLPVFVVAGLYVAGFLVRGVVKSRHVISTQEE